MCIKQDDALLALVTELLIIAGGTGESDESMVNRQTALYSLKLLSRHLASKHPNQFKEVRLRYSAAYLTELVRAKSERRTSDEAPTKGQRSKRQHLPFTLRWYNLLNQFPTDAAPVS